MTKENGKLDFIRVYDLVIEDEEQGEVVFVGRRKRINTQNLEHPKEPWYLIAGIHGSIAVCFKFSGDEFSLEDGRLVVPVKKRERESYLSPAEREYVEDRLEILGSMKLEANHAYDLDMNGRDFGRCLYLGERRGRGLVYRHQIVRRVEGNIFSTVFRAYKLKGNTLKPINKRNHPLSRLEREHLGEMADGAGL